MLNDLIRVKDKVEALLDKWPELRDDDTALFATYRIQYHDVVRRLRGADDPAKEWLDIEMDPRIPSRESVRRTRQKFQQDGLYLGEKRAERLEEEDRVREWARE